MCLGVLVVGFKGCYLGGVLVVALWLVVVLFVWLMGAYGVVLCVSFVGVSFVLMFCCCIWFYLVLTCDFWVWSFLVLNWCAGMRGVVVWVVLFWLR